MKIVAEIPARLGSERVKEKNLRLLNGKPMIAYAIEAALQSKYINEVYVNTESDVIGEVGLSFGAKFYKRKHELATNDAKQDEFNYDFIVNTGTDVLVLVNPVAPLVQTKEIDAMIQYYLVNNYDTIIPVKEEFIHTFYTGKPLNFSSSGMLQKTQDLEPIQMCAWTVVIWKAKSFIANFESRGFANFVGNVGLYKVDPLTSIKVSNEHDFYLAEALLIAREDSK